MAILFRDEFYSNEGTRYRVAIDDDTLGSDGNLSFELGAGLFNLSYSGENDNRFQSVITSRVTLSMVIDSTVTEDFIEDCINSVDGRFKLRIEKYKKSSLTWELFWTGTIITDQVTYEDASYPFFFNITAIDQLGTLSKIDYNNDGQRYYGDNTIMEHLVFILDKTTLQYFHAATDVFIRTVCNWYDTAHVYNAGDPADPLVNTRVNHIAFFSEDTDGNIIYFNCLDVLKQLAKVFGARIYQSDGAIRFEQVNEREDADFYEFQYDEDGTQLSKGLNTTDTITTLKTKTNTHLAGGQFAFLPGLKYVRLEYNHKSNRNLLFNLSWSNVLLANLVIGEVTSDTTTTTLNFNSNLYVSLDVDTVGSDLFRIEFDLFLRFGNKYLKREITDIGYGSIGEGAVTWETTSEKYVVSSERFGLNSQYLNIPVTFQTPVLPDAVGELEFGFTGLRYYKNAVEIAPTETVITINNYELQTPILELFLDGSPSSLSRQRLYQVNNDLSPGNTETETISTFLGDALTVVTRGKLEVYDGTDWESSTDWAINKAGTTYSIMELMILEILAGQKRGTFKYIGAFQISSFMFHHRLVYSNLNYMMMSGSFDASRDTWSGSFFNLDVNRNNLSFSTEISSGGSNSGGLPSGGGSSSGGSSTTSYIPPVPEYFLNVVGASITGLSGTLPGASLADQFLAVYRDGRKLKHTTHYTIDESNNEIDLVLQAMGEDFEIIIFS